MSIETLRRRFATVGARLDVADGPWVGEPRLDVRTDRRGELFTVDFAKGEHPVELEVVDVRPKDRHLLLLARVGEEKSKFLCGHDERHWFVAAVPESARGVTGVAQAKAALQPDAVRELVERRRPKNPFSRKNSAFLRQGEWFFVPEPDLGPPKELVLRDEPLRRGGRPQNGVFPSAHMLQFAYRRGGRLVFVNRQNPFGISEEKFAALSERERRSSQWQRMVAEPELFAKGTVRHPDHATVHLAGWHRVLMNTEPRAKAMQHVVFLD